MPCYNMVAQAAAAAAPAQHRGGRSTVRLDADAVVDGPSASSAIGVHRHTRPPGFSLFSGTASAALFASLALCLLLVCAYSYVARRRAIYVARRRFLGRLRDLDLVPGRPYRCADVPRVATASPAPAVAKAPGSGPAGDCPVCLEPLRGAGGITAAAHACGHVFHVPCIEPWLDRRDSCPVCRCTISCTREEPANNEEPAAAAGDGARRLRETVVVVIAAETAASAAGSDDDEMQR